MEPMRRKIESIVDHILADDIKFLNELVRSRRKTGYLLMLVGFCIVIGSMSYMFLLIPIGYAKQPSIFSGTFWIVFILVAIGYTLMHNGYTIARSSRVLLNPGGGRYRFYVKLECPRCDFIVVRERRENEFVGDRAEDLCEKCNEHMVITGIFAEPERKIQPIGFPLLQVPGQSILMELKAAIMSKLTPFKLGLREDKEDRKKRS